MAFFAEGEPSNPGDPAKIFICETVFSVAPTDEIIEHQARYSGERERP